MSPRSAVARVAVVRGGLPHFAEVALSVERRPGQGAILDRCQGRGWRAQGCAEDATADGYDDWKQGALRGARRGLREAGVALDDHLVAVERVTGMTTDTNPDVVEVAAARAVWEALGHRPSSAQEAALAALLDGSWARWRA